MLGMPLGREDEAVAGCLAPLKSTDYPLADVHFWKESALSTLLRNEDFS